MEPTPCINLDDNSQLERHPREELPEEKVPLQDPLQIEAPPQEEAQPSASRKTNTSVTHKIHHAMDGVTKEMDMALKAKIDVEVTLSVIKNEEALVGS